MTAETLKPFITPQQRVDNFPVSQAHKKQQKCCSTKILAFGLGISGIILATILLGLTCWSLQRVAKMETEVEALNKIIGNLHRQLGITYLEDLHEAEEFEKEYTNALFDDPDDENDHDSPDGDKDVDDDDDDIDIDEDDDDDDDSDSDDDDDATSTFLSEDYYDELIKKYNSYDDADADEDDEDDDSNPANVSDDDNLYDDFEKFKDSKRKKQNDFRSNRKTRAIAEVNNNLPNIDEYQKDDHTIKSLDRTTTTPSSDTTEKSNQQQQQQHHHHRTAITSRHFVSENSDKRQSPLRPRTNRRLKIPIAKSAKTATLNELNYHFLTPAAHYHLHRKVPDRYATMRVDSYNGDMYIGHASTPNDISSERFFKHNNGVLIIREPGLYYVYAQVCYNNTHDQNGFVIFHGHKPFLQCLNTVPTNMPMKIHTCHTSGLIKLEANETIHIRDFHIDRNVILKDGNNRSYFGIIKI